MGKNKAEYAGARRKIEQRTTWNPEKHSHTMQLMQNDLEMGLRHCLSGDEREVLNQSLRPSGHILWYKVIAEVKSDLLNALATTYPAMRMEVYGSTLMGIAFKGTVSSFCSHEVDFHRNVIVLRFQTADWTFTSTYSRTQRQTTRIK